jgi:hypothetical protein
MRACLLLECVSSTLPSITCTCMRVQPLWRGIGVSQADHVLQSEGLLRVFASLFCVRDSELKHSAAAVLRECVREGKPEALGALLQVYAVQGGRVPPRDGCEVQLAVDAAALWGSTCTPSFRRLDLISRVVQRIDTVA